MEVYGVVYLIINMVNGMKYVGQTTQPLEKRIRQHLYGTLYIDNAIKKHKLENFYYGVIKSCASKDELDYWEKFYIVVLKTKIPYGYNRSDGGGGSLSGWTLTAEAKENHSKRMLGNKNALGARRSPETRARIAASKIGEKNPNYGKPLSDEQKAILSLKLTGIKKNLDFNSEKNPFFGKKHAPKARIKISIARRGKSPYKNLVAEMDARQLTHKDIAQALGVSRRAVSRKIRGERNFTDNDKVKLEEIFGKPAEYLLQRYDE